MKDVYWTSATMSVNQVYLHNEFSCSRGLPEVKQRGQNLWPTGQHYD